MLWRRAGQECSLKAEARLIFIFQSFFNSARSLFLIITAMNHEAGGGSLKKKKARLQICNLTSNKTVCLVISAPFKVWWGLVVYNTQNFVKQNHRHLEDRDHTWFVFCIPTLGTVVTPSRNQTNVCWVNAKCSNSTFSGTVGHRFHFT